MTDRDAWPSEPISDVARVGFGIGGDFGLSLDPQQTVRAGFEKALALQPGRWRLFSSARAALAWYLADRGLVPGDEVLLPAYLCETILRPLAALRLQARFYRITRQLEVDCDDLERRIGLRTKALLVIHYFGFPQPERVMIRLREIESHLLVIEDCVQAGLTTDLDGRPLGSVGDACIASFRKFVAVPDGALLRSSALLRSDELPSADCIGALRAAGMLAKQRYLEVGDANPGTHALYTHLLREGEDAFGTGDPPTAPSTLSLQLLDAIDWADVQRTRRENYKTLAARLKGHPGVRLPFPDLSPGECPLGLPILLEPGKVRDLIQSGLANRGVYAPIHWRLPELPNDTAYSVASEIAQSELTLPIDQRYGPSEMEWIADVLESILGDRG